MTKPGQRDFVRKFSFFEREVYKGTPSEENGNRTKALIKNEENKVFNLNFKENMQKAKRMMCTKHSILCFCSLAPK